MHDARHIDCTLAEYHAMKGSYSHSQIEDLIASPPLFHGRHIAGIWAREEGPALDVGTVAHAALLDEAGFSGVATIVPPDALNKDGHRKGPDWAIWSGQQGNKILLKESEASSIMAMVNNVRRNRHFATLTRTPVLREYSIIWTDEETGLTLRARPDIIARPRGRCLPVEIKTTRAVTERAFRRDAVTFGYFRQAAWQIEAVSLAFNRDDIAGSLFVVVDKSPAHECRVFEPSKEDLAVAHRQNHALIRDLAARLKWDNWKGRDDDRVIPLILPEWAKSELPWEVNEQ